jgi:methanethiol S-methyltransferase
MFLILLSLFLYGLIHSILASLRFKAWVVKQFGESRYQRWYRLFFNLMAVLTILPTLALVVFLPDRILYQIPFPWVLLTIAVQAAAALGLLHSVIITGAANFLGIQQVLNPVRAAQPHRMTKTGLYRWVRHPLYTCSILILWLVPVMTVNILAFNIGATAYMTIGAFFEERKLAREFGRDYEEYRRKTPMLIPGWKSKSNELRGS